MQSRAFAQALTLAFWLLASSAYGAAEDAPERGSPALVWVTLLLPCFGLVMLFFIIVRNRRLTTGHLERANRHIDRNDAHMALMEAKADRMIALLESIDRRLGE